MKPETCLYICRVCGQARDDSGTKPTNPLAQALHDELQRSLPAASGIRVLLTDCQSICTRPLAWGLRAPGKHAFTFALKADDTTPDAPELAQALKELTDTYHALPCGEKMGKEKFPPRLKGTLVSRLPPLPE